MNGAPDERDERGRFTKPKSAERRAHKVGQLRAAALRSVKSRDMGKVVAALLERAKAGEVEAAEVLFKWTLGPAVAGDVVDRIAALERAVETLPIDQLGQQK